MVFSPQISDAIYAQLKPYHTELVGKAISMEYALFVSVIVCALGGAAFLASSMTVEKDRRVSQTLMDLSPSQLSDPHIRNIPETKLVWQ